MFDWVAFEMDCPKCCTPVRGFQSKDRDCNLEVLLPSQVRRFYSFCGSCDCHIEFFDGKMINPTYSTGVETLPIPPDGRPFSG